MKIQAATVQESPQEMPLWVPAACGLSLLATFSAVLAFDGLAASASGFSLWMPALTPVFLLSYRSGFKGAMQGFGLGILLVTGSMGVGAIVEADWASAPFAIGITATLGLAAVGAGSLARCLRCDRQEVKVLALDDPLTGLPSRRHAEIYLRAAIGQSERGIPVTVVMFDLDNFKRYNDTFGHQGGDEVLKIFTEVLNDCTRRSNLTARMGGEAFLTILSDCNLHGGVIFAERVRLSLRDQALGLGLTVSAGVATHFPGTGNMDDLLAVADEALHDAKCSGRDCVRAMSTLITPFSKVIAA